MIGLGLALHLPTGRGLIDLGLALHLPTGRGLIGLGLASIRVLTYDITDLVGRIVACGVLAVAFLGIAWLYGRLTADQRDA